MEGTGAPRKTAGNTVKRNIFAWTGGGAHAMLASQVGWSAGFLKPNGSDYNLYWSPTGNVSASPLFPGHQTLAQWQGKAAQDGNPTTCDLPGDAGKLTVSARGCTFGWVHNGTDGTVRASAHFNFPKPQTLNIDCDGDWSNCASGIAGDTRLCLSGLNGIGPHPPAPEVDNQGWHHDAATGGLVAYGSGKCITVCNRGGDVGGCNGQTGSIVQLQPCDGTLAQKWSFGKGASASGSLRPASAPLLCLSPPPKPAADAFDEHSIIANPLFVDADAGTS